MIPPVVQFTVVGKAEPAGSKKAFLPKGGRFPVIVDANDKAKPWKSRVAEVAAEHFTGDLLRGPLLVELAFFQPRPASHYGTGRNSGTVKDSAPDFPTSRPDVLKLARGVEDALTGTVYRDDSQIVTECLSKRYGAPARCEVSVFDASAYLFGRSTVAA